MNHTPDINFLQNKTVLITGGGGTVGKELIRQILRMDPYEIRIIDNNEAEVFYLQEVFRREIEQNTIQTVGSETKIQAFIGDIRNEVTMSGHCRGVDVLFHTAAFKHVILCERSPHEAVQSNILGVENIINSALKNNVEKVIFTSSDKAVNPTNVMGTSKLMGERLITAANSMKNGERTVFSSVRFGNVIGSRGSVLPIFAKQIANGGPVTITHPAMTRFVMTVEQSVGLLLEAARLARGGEVLVTKMPVVRILDLAKAMIKVLTPRYGYEPNDITIEEIGVKPGEKFYEELMTEEEMTRSIELEKMFAILPAFRSVYEDITYDYADDMKKQADRPYVSNNEIPMNVDQIIDYITSNNIV